MALHPQMGALFVGALAGFVCLGTLRDGYVIWGRWSNKRYHRDRYPLMFYAFVAWSGLFALWCISTGLDGTWNPRPFGFVIFALLGTTISLGKWLDERRNSQGSQPIQGSSARRASARRR
jgi:O-antigen ligase